MPWNVGEAWRHRRDPIVADHRLDWACGTLWLIYGLWGILTPIVDRNVILATTPSFYPTYWGGIIGVCGLIASGAVLGNLTADGDVSRRIATKRIEMFAVTGMGVLIGFYPVIQFIGLVSGQLDRLDSFVLSFAYIVIPVWRILHLFDRVRSLRQISFTDG